MQVLADNPLSFAAAALTMAAGIFGFFWAKSGARNEVGGVGWAALVLIVASGIVAVAQAYGQGNKAAEAKKKAEAASERAEFLAEELRRAQFTSSAVLLTLVNDFDLPQPISQAHIQFNAPERDGRVAQPRGFVGPFPRLPRGATAEFAFSLDETIYRNLKIEPTAAGGLRFSSPYDPQAASFAIEPDGRGYRNHSDWHDGPGVPPGISIGHTDLGMPTDDILQPRPQNPLYILPLEQIEGAQFRTLITQLVRQKNYGMLRINKPDTTREEVQKIIAIYDRLAPSVVLHVPMRATRLGAMEPCQTSLIRIPLMFRFYSQDASGVTLEIVSDLRGFRSEVCLES